MEETVTKILWAAAAVLGVGAISLLIWGALEAAASNITVIGG